MNSKTSYSLICMMALIRLLLAGLVGSRRAASTTTFALTAFRNSPSTSHSTSIPQIKTSQQQHRHSLFFTRLASSSSSSHIDIASDEEGIAKALPKPLMDSRGNILTNPSDIAKLVQGKRVGLYFAAGWCPQCRELEIVLPQYMKALEESKQAIALIYIPSDHTNEFALDRMRKLNVTLGVPYGNDADAIKRKYKIWSGREDSTFANEQGTKRAGVPSFVVLDTYGNEFAFLDTERHTIGALSMWPLDDPKGIF